MEAQQALMEALEALQEASDAEWIQDARGSFDTARESLEAVAGETREALTSLETQTQSLTQAQNEALESLDGAAEMLVTEITTQRTGLQESASEVAERSAEFAEADLDSLMQEFQDSLDELTQSLCDSLQEQHRTLLSTCDDDFAAAGTDAAEALTASANTLAQIVRDSLGDLIARLGEGFRERIEAQARATVADVAARMTTEVAANVALTQASVAITGAVSPILPQLIALRAVVSAIKAALKLMRGGF
jgi:DNA anti-recombination protein RmuC